MNSLVEALAKEMCIRDSNMGCRAFARKGESAYDAEEADFSVLGGDGDE